MLKRHSDLLACSISDRSESLSSTRSTELDSQAVTQFFCFKVFYSKVLSKLYGVCYPMPSISWSIHLCCWVDIQGGSLSLLLVIHSENPHYCSVSLVLCFFRSMLFPLQCHGCAIHEIYCLGLRTQLSFGPCYSMYFASIHTIDQRIATGYQNWWFWL
jgi:hypothetical protein